MSVFALFLEGLLSFLSPCVLPLLPLYMSYLSINGKQEDEDGNISYKSGHVLLMTIFFVLGISVIFVVLALSIDLVKPFVEKYKEIISIIGGTIIIIFGLNEVGIIHIDVLNLESKIKLNIDSKNMNYLKAFLLGFVFAFGWSPCIGPMLASAIIIASTESLGSLYILVYGLGLIIPFIITGLFTSTILNFLKNKKSIFKYVLVIAGIILIIYGVYMIRSASKTIIARQSVTSSTTVFENQDGEIINLDDYKGKYIFLNYTTTWCTYCKEEIPVYKEFSDKGEDYICFYVMSPLTSGVSKEEIIEYIKENNIEVPVLIDEYNKIYNTYNPTGYPMMYVLDKQGDYIGYVEGALDSEGFENVYQEILTY